MNPFLFDICTNVKKEKKIGNNVIQKMQLFVLYSLVIVFTECIKQRKKSENFLLSILF